MDSSKIIGGGSAGGAIGAASVYIAGRFGAHLTPEDGALIASAAVAIVAFLAHNGIRGAFGLVWSGGADPSAPAPAAEAAPTTRY